MLASLNHSSIFSLHFLKLSPSYPPLAPSQPQSLIAFSNFQSPSLPHPQLSRLYKHKLEAMLQGLHTTVCRCLHCGAMFSSAEAHRLGCSAVQTSQGEMRRVRLSHTCICTCGVYIYIHTVFLAGTLSCVRCTSQHFLCTQPKKCARAFNNMYVWGGAYVLT